MIYVAVAVLTSDPSTLRIPQTGKGGWSGKCHHYPGGPGHRCPHSDLALWTDQEDRGLPHPPSPLRGGSSSPGLYNLRVSQPRLLNKESIPNGSLLFLFGPDIFESVEKHLLVYQSGKEIASAVCVPPFCPYNRSNSNSLWERLSIAKESIPLFQQPHIPSLTLALPAARMDTRGSVIQEVRRWARNWFLWMGTL